MADNRPPEPQLALNLLGDLILGGCEGRLLIGDFLPELGLGERHELVIAVAFVEVGAEGGQLGALVVPLHRREFGME